MDPTLARRALLGSPHAAGTGPIRLRPGQLSPPHEDDMTDTPTGSETSPPSPAKPSRKESVWEVYYPFNSDQEKDAVPVASFPMIIYFWPSLIAFLVCGVVQLISGGPFAEDGSFLGSTLGWWATGALAFNLMIIVTDLDQKKFVIFILLLALAGTGLYVGKLQGWGVIGRIGHWIEGLELYYSTHTYLLVGFLLALFFVMGMATPRFNYWRLEPNEFVHYIQPWGRDQSIPRLGSTVSREVPDVLELILTFGGGTIVIKRENQVVARIEHVPFLGKRMKSIERLLGVTRVKQS